MPIIATPYIYLCSDKHKLNKKNKENENNN